MWPSSGELVALQDKDNSLESKLNTKLIKVSDKTMDISATYWSSTERNNKNMYIVTYSKTAGSDRNRWCQDQYLHLSFFPGILN